MRFQNETSCWGGSRYLPYVFTEHGVTMLASILKSDTEIQVNINIVRAFIAFKQYHGDFKLLKIAIEELESKFNRKIENIHEIIEYLLSKPVQQEDIPRKRIGFKP